MYYSSLSPSKHSFYVYFFVVVVILLVFACNVSSLNLTNTYLHHKCFVDQGEYKSGSQFDKTLTILIDQISELDLRSGADYITIGKSPNAVTVKLQCRGDSYGSMCRSCFKVAISDILKRCPRNKGRIIWYDQCFVETTIVPIDDDKARIKIDYKNNFFLHNPNKVSGDANFFNKETISFLQNLTEKANDEANKGENGEIALYAAGEKMIGTKKLYAMVQCIRDTFVMYEKKLCKKCLDTIINKDFPKCCDGKQGGRVLGTSCTFRYEFYPFLRT
ncbi:unnamed protein product [Cochlearia groenlandica]